MIVVWSWTCLKNNASTVLFPLSSVHWLGAKAPILYWIFILAHQTKREREREREREMWLWVGFFQLKIYLSLTLLGGCFGFLCRGHHKNEWVTQDGHQLFTVTNLKNPGFLRHKWGGGVPTKKFPSSLERPTFFSLNSKLARADRAELAWAAWMSIFPTIICEQRVAMGWWGWSQHHPAKLGELLQLQSDLPTSFPHTRSLWSSQCGTWRIIPGRVT